MMGMSPQRVRALAISGEIPARKLGRQWAIDEAAIVRRPQLRPRGGRPISARSAWALLALAGGGVAPWLSRGERARAESRLLSLAALRPHELAARAKEYSYRVHRGGLEHLQRDPRLVLGGVSAAGETGADIVALGSVEAYVRAEDREGVVHGHRLEPAAGPAANVLLRVPRELWIFPEGMRVAPPAAVGADLVDAGDERSVRAGRIIFARLIEGLGR